MITIVTSRLYLLCEAINAIKMEYYPERLPNNRFLPFYTIALNITPQNRGTSSDETEQVEIRICGEKAALSFFKELVTQIREQMPDQVYLDKMLEDILAGGKDIYDDSRTTSLSRAGEKKKRSKTILRGSTRGRRGSRR